MDESGSFSIKRLSNLLKIINASIGTHHSWNALLPKKVNICTWRASLNRLPTRTKLLSRGLNLHSVCEAMAQDLDHLLFGWGARVRFLFGVKCGRGGV